MDGKAMHLFRDTILIDVMVCETCPLTFRKVGTCLLENPITEKNHASCLDLDGQHLFFRRITEDMMIAEGIPLMFKLLLMQIRINCIAPFLELASSIAFHATNPLKGFSMLK